MAVAVSWDSWWWTARAEQIEESSLLPFLRSLAASGTGTEQVLCCSPEPIDPSFPERFVISVFSSLGYGTAILVRHGGRGNRSFGTERAMPSSETTGCGAGSP